MSKFSGLLEHRKTNPLPTLDASSIEVQTSRLQEGQHSSSLVPIAQKARQRPKGKKGDPAYTQVTAYIKTETYQRTQIRLLQLRGKKKEVSELLQELLTEWLARSEG